MYFNYAFNIYSLKIRAEATDKSIELILRAICCTTTD